MGSPAVRSDSTRPLSQPNSRAVVPILCLRSPGMSLARWEERLAPFDGIVAVAFWVAGVLVLQGPADQPDQDASPARALLFFKQEDGAILLGTFLFMIGTLFFLWFLGLLRIRLIAFESGGHRLTGIVFAGGVATAVSLLLMPAVHAAGAINNENLSADAAQVYLGINVAFFYAAELSAAVFLLALGLVSLATGAFPTLARVGQPPPRRVARDPADRLGGASLGVPALADRGQPRCS